MKNLRLLLLYFILLIFGFPNLSSQSLSLTMPDTLVDSGDAITIPIHMSFSDTGIAGIQFDVSYDSSVLTATGCSIGNLVGACNEAFAPDTFRFVIFTASGSLPNNIDLCFMDFNASGVPGSQTQLSISNIVAAAVDLSPIPDSVITTGGGLVQIDCQNTLLILSGQDYFAGDTIKREAHQSILAFNKINSGADIIYDAGSQVMLQGGFEVFLGAEFTARIDGCFGQ